MKTLLPLSLVTVLALGDTTPAVSSGTTKVQEDIRQCLTSADRAISLLVPAVADGIVQVLNSSASEVNGTLQCSSVISHVDSTWKSSCSSGDRTFEMEGGFSAPNENIASFVTSDYQIERYTGPGKNLVKTVDAILRNRISFCEGTLNEEPGTHVFTADNARIIHYRFIKDAEKKEKEIPQEYYNTKKSLIKSI